MVWLSETGEKYHSINNCGRMNPERARQVTLEEARSLGMEPCSKCWQEVFIMDVISNKQINICEKKKK